MKKSNGFNDGIPVSELKYYIWNAPTYINQLSTDQVKMLAFFLTTCLVAVYMLSLVNNLVKNGKYLVDFV